MSTWWKRGIVYQIYPRSFQDSNGDGVGDLRGIAARLDYLRDLGVDALWLSPIFPSPMKDFGYDVADYVEIEPLFGTLADFDHLLAEAHARDLRVVLDLVPNHTSDQHVWFREARSSRTNPKRDWYIWRDARPDGSPPNNWLAYFGGPAWTWDETTGQYYLHSFLPEQPDLNYHNPDVKAAIFDSIRFWLRRGVDGFRIDVIDRMIKDSQLRDNPPNPDYVEGRDNPMWSQLRVYSENQPEVHALIAEFHRVFDEFADRVSIGEIAYSTDPGVITGFYGPTDQREIDLPFNFALLLLPWEAEAVRRFADGYDAAIPPDCWGNYVMGNHDQARLASRIGPDAAAAAAVMLLTLRGTPFIYQGEELGLPNLPLTPDQYRDPQGINTGVSRDFCRGPIPWTGEGPYAGFSSVEPWLPVAPDYAQVNAQAQAADPDSMLSLYKRLIALRRARPALREAGRYRSVDAAPGVFAYWREAADGDSLCVLINFTGETQTIAAGALGLKEGARIVLSSVRALEGQAALGSDGAVTLHPHEGRIIGS